MKRYKANIIDFNCHSNGNNEINTALTPSGVLAESYKLVYVYGGVCRFDIDGKCYEASAGDSVLLYPYVDFAIDAGENGRYAWIEISGFVCAVVMGHIAFSRKMPLLGKMDIPGFEKRFDFSTCADETYLLYRMGGCVLLLLSYYIERFPGKVAETEDHVYTARRYIDAHYSERGFGVKDVAQALKIDRSYLYRIFKERTGMSVIDYITHYRILRAEAMLANSMLSIKDIAYSVGFSDQMYFSRVFKKQNGRTPTEFREQLFSKRDTPLKP